MVLVFITLPYVVFDLVGGFPELQCETFWGFFFRVCPLVFEAVLFLPPPHKHT